MRPRMPSEQKICYRGLWEIHVLKRSSQRGSRVKNSMACFPFDWSKIRINKSAPTFHAQNEGKNFHASLRPGSQVQRKSSFNLSHIGGMANLSLIHMPERLSIRYVIRYTSFIDAKLLYGGTCVVGETWLSFGSATWCSVISAAFRDARYYDNVVWSRL